MTVDAVRRVLVTGASRGIGRAVAVALAQDGFDVVCNARGSVSDVVDEIRDRGGRASPMRGDVGEREPIRLAIEASIADDGAFYGVVCNAGTHADAAFPALTPADWDDVMRTNLDAFFNVVQPCIMPMIRLRRGGRIVAMSSVSGIAGNRGQVNYSAAKAGLIGAVKALAVELAKRRITVNCVAPGIIETDMGDDVPDEVVSHMVPLRRRGTPDEVAGLVRFLFSDPAAYITRQAISVNGGMV